MPGKSSRGWKASFRTVAVASPTAAMSCSDVARHQPPQLKLPSSVAAASCSAAPCPFPALPFVQSQQTKFAVYSKMQESLDVVPPNKQEEDEKDQPAEMEYLNSRCVLFTYFQGDIESVVDEHFSRALNQTSSFNPEFVISKNKAGLNPLWRENATIASQRSGFPASFWTSSYQTPPPPCLGGLHHDLPVTAPSTFSTADPSNWPGRSLHQTVPPPPHSLSESWHYPLASQFVQARFLHHIVMQPRQILLLSPVLPQHGQELFMEQSTLFQPLGLTQAYSTRKKEPWCKSPKIRECSQVFYTWKPEMCSSLN
ncbi:transcription cofactor vestigial-like protein 3 isoform X5 [Sphaerodactylus townsendi]|uniref:transcription cofactor vestigial-like protein 3 isoform X5 n=1 Tax=Sphaerodactylus townsendi TaxID=933632 RepID=UPI0020269D36|nr:transcription cofactor vestigial-like protein 3 isoform X5 [Sphaerodactylus townsendi]